MVHDDALVHEQEQNFIRGREKSDRGREVGVYREGSEGRGGGKWRERGGKWGMGTPPVHPLICGYIECFARDLFPRPVGLTVRVSLGGIICHLYPQVIIVEAPFGSEKERSDI